MTHSFEELGIRTEMAEAMAKSGIRQPTPIQDKTIPALLAGKDVIAQAQTGTGKTLAFLLPILERYTPDHPGVQALIVTPTRELALQITQEAKKLAPIAGAAVLAVYGGQDVEAQVHKLKRATSIVVATPGRLLDHLRRETIQLGRIKTLVLDEADQMLSMGFLGEVEEIIRQTPRGRQMMLFSATMPEPVRRLAAEFMRQPEDVQVREGRSVTLENIRQQLVETTDRAKQDQLVRLLEEQRPFLAMIFCRTKIRAKNLTQALLDRGFEVDELHGDLTQAKREQVMKRFRSADLPLLVATDVAARGLDVEGVTHVFNYDIPHDAESYIHRIGRTGRAKHEGQAITLAAPRDRMHVEAIERGIGMKLERAAGMAKPGDDRARGVGRTAEGDVKQGERRRGRSDGPRRSGRAADKPSPRGSGGQRRGREDARRGSAKPTGNSAGRGRSSDRRGSAPGGARSGKPKRR